MKREFTVNGVFNITKMHYEDAEHFLSMAKEHKKQNDREMEKRYSRSSILANYFRLEALINFILYEMHHEKIFSTRTLENLEKMNIYDKYLLAPLICEHFSGETLDKNDLEYLNRLSSLRNDYVHSKHFKTKPITKIDVVVKILKTTEGLKEILPEIRTEDKKDNITGIKTNIIDLDYEDALKAKEITDRLLEKMNVLLNGLLLGKKDLPDVSKKELFLERAGLHDGLLKSDIIASISEDEYKETDDYRMKAILTQFVKENLTGENKKQFDSLSAREKEEIINELVRELKLRRRYVEDKRNLH